MTVLATTADAARDERRRMADDLADVLGDWDLLPERVRDGLYPLLHDWRTK